MKNDHGYETAFEQRSNQSNKTGPPPLGHSSNMIAGDFASGRNDFGKRKVRQVKPYGTGRLHKNILMVG